MQTTLSDVVKRIGALEKRVSELEKLYTSLLTSSTTRLTLYRYLQHCLYPKLLYLEAYLALQKM